jgi:hypothetical protein
MTSGASCFRAGKRVSDALGPLYSERNFITKVSRAPSHSLPIWTNTVQSRAASHCALGGACLLCWLAQISKYQKVVNIPNSMTVLYDMLPIAITMTRRKLTGTYNFTNPGVISHNEILDLYREVIERSAVQRAHAFFAVQYIDPAFKYVNFTEEEQNKILKAERSNNELVRQQSCDAR